MVDIETYRCRIGAFVRRGLSRKQQKASLILNIVFQLLPSLVDLHGMQYEYCAIFELFGIKTTGPVKFAIPVHIPSHRVIIDEESGAHIHLIRMLLQIAGIEVNPGPDQYRCSTCKTFFSNFTDVINHLIKTHPDNQIQYLKQTHQGSNIYQKKTVSGCVPNILRDNSKYIKVVGEESLVICSVSADSGESTPQKVVKKKAPSTPTIENQTVKRESAAPRRELFTNEQTDNQSVVETMEFVTESITATNESPEWRAMVDEMTALIPAVLLNLQKAGKLNSYVKFQRMLAKDCFPLDNIAFLLFLDVVNWFSNSNTCTMRYEYEETIQFWMIGFCLFHGKWLRFMSGQKNLGQVLDHTAERGDFDPLLSSINFAVPHIKQLRKEIEKTGNYDIMPGIITTAIDNISDYCDLLKAFKVTVDGKKLNQGKGKMGDIDCFGHEGPPSLGDKKMALESELKLVDEVEVILQDMNGNVPLSVYLAMFVPSAIYK